MTQEPGRPVGSNNIFIFTYLFVEENLLRLNE